MHKTRCRPGLRPGPHRGANDNTQKPLIGFAKALSLVTLRQRLNFLQICYLKEIHSTKLISIQVY